jgi:hypothetical protein
MGFFERFQVFFGIVVGAVLFACVLAAAIVYCGGRVTPAYAAASDVKGSPNVTVAAFPVSLTNGSEALLEVMADGGTKTSPLSGMSFSTGRSCAAFADGGGKPVIYTVGNDGKLYYVQGDGGGGYSEWVCVTRSVPVP